MCIKQRLTKCFKEKYWPWNSSHLFPQAISLSRRLCLVLFCLDTQPCKPQPRQLLQGPFSETLQPPKENAGPPNQSLELDRGPPAQHAEHQDLRRPIIYKIGSSLVYSQHPSRCLVCVCCMTMKIRILIGPLDLHIFPSSHKQHKQEEDRRFASYSVHNKQVLPHVVYEIKGLPKLSE